MANHHFLSDKTVRTSDVRPKTSDPYASFADFIIMIIYNKAQIFDHTYSKKGP